MYCGILEIVELFPLGKKPKLFGKCLLLLPGAIFNVIALLHLPDNGREYRNIIPCVENMWITEQLLAIL